MPLLSASLGNTAFEVIPPLLAVLETVSRFVATATFSLLQIAHIHSSASSRRCHGQVARVTGPSATGPWKEGGGVGEVGGRWGAGDAHQLAQADA